MNALFVIGIDPSTRLCGVGVVKVGKDNKITYVKSDCIVAPELATTERIRYIGSCVGVIQREIERQGGTTMLAIEEPFSSSNDKGISKVWITIGSIIQSTGCRAEFVTADQIRDKTGATRMLRDDKKAQAIQWAREAFNIEVGDDTAEALAAAMIVAGVERDSRRPARIVPLRK